MLLNPLDGLADEWEKVLRYYLKRKKAGVLNVIVGC